MCLLFETGLRYKDKNPQPLSPPEKGCRARRAPSPRANPLSYSNPAAGPGSSLRPKGRILKKPDAPRRHAERAHAEADYDEENAPYKHPNFEAGHRTGPGDTTDS